MKKTKKERAREAREARVAASAAIAEAHRKRATLDKEIAAGRRTRETLPVPEQVERIAENKRKTDALDAAIAEAHRKRAALDAEKLAEAQRKQAALDAEGIAAPVPPPPPSGEGWRARYPVHPVTAMFPRLSPGELNDLAADIKAHGLRERVVLAGTPEQPCLLDGVNRMNALAQLGIPFDEHVHARWEDDTADVVSVILSLNLHRRHLSAKQKVEIVQRAHRALAYGISPRTRRNSKRGRPLTDVGKLARVTRLHRDTVRAVLDQQRGKPKKTKKPPRRLPDAAWIAQDGQLPELPRRAGEQAEIQAQVAAQVNAAGVAIAKERAARAARWGQQTVQEHAPAVPVWKAGQDAYDFEAAAFRLEFFMIDLLHDVQAWKALREQATGDRRHQLHHIEDRGHLIHAQLGELATEVRALRPHDGPHAAPVEPEEH